MFHCENSIVVIKTLVRLVKKNIRERRDFCSLRSKNKFYLNGFS